MVEHPICNRAVAGSSPTVSSSGSAEGSGSGGLGGVAEWLMAADCKSAAPCGLRRFESSPVHQKIRAVVAQLVERVLGKDEVTSSILVIGSSLAFAASVGWSNKQGPSATREGGRRP